VSQSQVSDIRPYLNEAGISGLSSDWKNPEWEDVLESVKAITKERQEAEQERQEDELEKEQMDDEHKREPSSERMDEAGAEATVNLDKMPKEEIMARFSPSSERFDPSSEEDEDSRTEQQESAEVQAQSAGQPRQVCLPGMLPFFGKRPQRSQRLQELLPATPEKMQEHPAAKIKDQIKGKYKV